MTKLYGKRFNELFQQMKILIDSKKNKYNSFLEKNEIEIDHNSLLEWIVKARNLLSKACSDDSEHYKTFIVNEKTGAYGTYLETLERLQAVFLAAKEDFEGGYLQSTRSLVQAEVFDSQLEQAKELFDSGYFSAAAVVAGVVLETALRALCDQNKITHGKLDKMNADLAKKEFFQSLYKNATQHLQILEIQRLMENMRNSLLQMLKI